MADKGVLPHIPADEWIRRLQRRVGGRFPMQATLELTERCNLRCVHCYVNQPAGDSVICQRELSLTEWQDIFDQMAQTNVLWLLITGGEPLLRPDFAEVYSYARQKGFHVTLYTNGTLLTPELADLLAAQPPWQVEITLYGATAETYERITGVPGSYARCIRAIEMLCERGVHLGLKTMVLTLNRGEIFTMQKMAEAWGAEFRYDPLVFSRLDGNRRPLDYRLLPEEIIALERQDALRLHKWQEFCGQPWLPPDRERLFPCGAGEGVFHVDTYGGLYPCIMARWLRYDLRAGALEKALREFLPAVRRLPRTQDATCRECDLAVLCQNCPAWAYRETGDCETPEPFRCRLAHLRSSDLGLKVHIVSAPQMQAA